MYNQVTLIGRLGKDTDLKTFEGGGKVASNTVATSDNYKNKQGEWVDVTDWHNIQCSGYAADSLAKIDKGSLVLAIGKNKQRSYEKDGVRKYVNYVQVSKIRNLSPKEAADLSGSNDQKYAEANHATAGEDFGDLPF